MALFTLPRAVNIVNPKLTLVYWVLFLVVLALTVFNFVLGRQYLSPQSVQPRIAFELWPTAASYEDVKQDVEHSIRNSDLCLSPEQYDYWWDAAGSWRYENYTCLPVCPQGLHHWGCVQVSDSFERFSMQNMMLVTAVRETFSQATTSRHSASASRNYWIMSSRSSSIDFTYSYEVQDQNPLSRLLGPLSFLFGGSSVTTIEHGSSVGGPNVKPLRTIILDSKGQFWRAVLPGPSITLSMSELLELIGERALFDNPNRYATPNQLNREGGMKGNPVVQITGAKLQLDVGCYNVHNPNLEGVELPKELGDLDQSSMCSLKVRRLPTAWATSTRDDYVEGGLLARSAAGIDISCSYSGKFQYVDVGQIFISLMACLVALGIPGKVLLFISLNCLGHLSQMYKRVLVHDFDISEQVAGAAARLSLFSLSYEAFGDPKNTNGISLVQFRERLQLVLGGDPRLSKEEIEAMADFCFRRSFARNSFRHRRTGFRSGLKLMGLKSIDEELGITRQQTMGRGIGVMCLQDFCSACCRAEPLDLTDMAVYFDKDRKTSFVERAFTPTGFWKAVFESKSRSKEARDADLCEATGHRQSEASSVSSGSASHGQLSLVGFQAEDVQALATSLSTVLDRLSAAELRLAESERSVMAWKQQSSDLGLAMGHMEKRLQELEGRIKSDVEIQAKGGLCDNILSATAPDLNETKQGLLPREYMDALDATSSKTTAFLDELTDRVAMLERRMAIAAADLFGIIHAEEYSGLTMRSSHWPRSLPPAQRGERRLERAHDDHAVASRGTEPSSLRTANGVADLDFSHVPRLSQDYA